MNLPNPDENETAAQFIKQAPRLLSADVTMPPNRLPASTAMPKRYSVSSAFAVILSVALVTVCALGILAQSGRRVRKPEPAPVPIPEATPLSTPPLAKEKPAFTFIVGLEKYSDFSRASLSDYSGVLRSCAQRLNESRAVRADTESRDQSRAAAIQKAKAEKEAYIVWLQLRSNTTSARTGGDDPNNLYIEYTVFAPVTAKQVTSGNAYPDAYRRTPVRIPTSPTVGDYYLNQAARGVAERILDHFHVRTAGTLP